MRQIARNRVATVAAPGAIEVCLPCFRITIYDIQNPIRTAQGGIFHALVQKRGNILNLLLRKAEFRHAFIRPPIPNNLADLLAGFIIENYHRTQQIRSALSALGIRAMAEGTASKKEL